MACLLWVFRRKMCYGYTDCIMPDVWLLASPGDCFHIEMSTYQNKDCHYEDMTTLWSLYLHNGVSYAVKMACLDWNGAQVGFTHWGQVIHIRISKLTIIGLDNGLSPGWCQAIIGTNGGILIWTIGSKFNEILIEIYTFSVKKMLLNMSSGKWRLFCLGLNVLK